MNERNITKIVRNMSLYKNKRNKGQNLLNDTEFEMVRYLTKREGLSQSDLASYLNVDKALITRMTKKLELAGYITISVDAADGRKRILSATAKAHELKQVVANEEIEFYNACFRVLTPQEQESLSQLIEKVYLESKRLRKNKFEGVKNENSSL